MTAEIALTSAFLVSTPRPPLLTLYECEGPT